MADVVTDAVADLTTKMQTVTAIQDKIIYMFEMDDLLSERTKVGIPAIGVVYNSLVGKRDQRNQGSTGLAATLTLDIYILGGDQCVEKISRETGIKTTTTQFLDDIRNTIKNTKIMTGTGSSQAVRPQSQRIWTFVEERPLMMQEEVITYLQRWDTTVLLT